MKEFCEHISTCQNIDCKVRDCVSSRYILSHYRRCKDKHCPVCVPVKDVIKRMKWKENIKLNDMSVSPLASYSSLPDFETDSLRV